MSFCVDVLTLNGAVSSYHILNRLEVSFPQNLVMAFVLCFANEAAYLAGGRPVESRPVQVPMDALNGPLEDSVQDWLTTDSESPFKGGVIVPNGSQTLEAAQARAWAAIKVARTAAEEGTFVFDGGVYQADVVRINGAVQLAVLAKANGTPYSETWTLEDNTTRVLDADQVIALGLALGQYVSGVFATGRALRDRINAATTIEEVQAIGWPA